MWELKFCRICLNDNVRMHQITESEVQDVYQKIINEKIQEDGSPYYACYICYHQLKNCRQLVIRSIKSEEILNKFLENGSELDLKTLGLMHRQVDLLSSMIVATLEPIEIFQSNDNIKSENAAEYDINEMVVKLESNDENKLEPLINYGVRNIGIPEPLNFGDSGSSGTEDDLPLKTILLHPLERKASVKMNVVKKNKYKEKILGIESNSKQNIDDVNQQKHNNVTAKHKRDKTIKRNCLTKDLKRKTVNCNNNHKGRSLKPIHTEQRIKQTDTHKQQKENTMKLLLNSNGCLFTSYKTKFGCDVCPERYLDIKDLREHIKTHSNDKYIVSNVNNLRGRSYKNVDISNLICKICDQSCQDLTELQTHLTVAHSMHFDGIANYLTPYKLENGLECILCQQKFNTFLRLSIHMNSHSTNNVCEICGMSYINRSSLRLHVQGLHKEKKCTLCSRTFQNNSTKMRHMRSVHRLGDYKRYCVLCEKTFRYTYLLVEHRIKEHGAKRTINECVECGKKFSSVCNLKIHTRSVHIRERNFPCSVCDMRFFTKCDQKRHERTHEDVRSFSCCHCEGRFKTKDSWRRHLKRQHAQLLLQT